MLIMDIDEIPSDELVDDLREYVRGLYECGTEAAELGDIEKRFPLIKDCSRVLVKIGCTVLDDLVLFGGFEFDK